MKDTPLRWLARASLLCLVALPHLGMAADQPGTLRWALKLSEGRDTECTEKIALALDDAGRLYAKTNGNNEIVALDPTASASSPRVLWRKRAPFGAACTAGPAHLAARNDMLYVAYPGLLGALRIPNGNAPTLAWKHTYAQPSKVFAQPVIETTAIHLSAREWRPANGDFASLDRLDALTGKLQHSLAINSSTPDTPVSKLVHLRWSETDNIAYLAGNYGLSNVVSQAGAPVAPLTERAMRSFTIADGSKAFAFERGIAPDQRAGRLVVLGKGGTQRYQVEKIIELPPEAGEAQDASKIVVGQNNAVYLTVYHKHKSQPMHVYKFDTQKGVLLWSYALPAMPNFASWEFDDDAIFLNATPTLGDDGTVYVSAVDAYRTPQLHAIDADTGLARWVYNHPPVYPIGQARGDYVTRLSAPLLGSENGTVYVGAVIENNSAQSPANARYTRQALILAINGEGAALAMSPWPIEYGDWGNNNAAPWGDAPARRSR